jgi:hypothetical protein
MAGAGGPMSTMVSYRCSSQASEEVQSWASVDLDALRSAVPWRTFRWQRHYSGDRTGHCSPGGRLEYARNLHSDLNAECSSYAATING